MDGMQEGGKNLKDTSLEVTDISFYLSYNKTNKLVTALYMVTDIMSETEALRQKLRYLAVELVSDIGHVKATNSGNKLDIISNNLFSILSLLDVSLTMGLVSKMNFNILSKEFTELKSCVERLKSKYNSENEFPSISELLLSPSREFLKEALDKGGGAQKDNLSYVGHDQPTTRIGVQKGKNLMRILSDRVSDTENKNEKNEKESKKTKRNVEMLKKERRFEIVKVFNDKMTSDGYNGLTITDIKKEGRGVLKDCSKKTLQRELVSMVEDGVLKKVGSKRWSKYFLKQEK